MSKKLLNETQVRRFMGLAGMNTNIVSNVIKEFAKTYEEEEEVQAMQETEYTQPVQEEEDPLPPAADDMPPVEDEPMEDPAGEPEMEITAEEADCLAPEIANVQVCHPDLRARLQQGQQAGGILQQVEECAFDREKTPH